MAKLLAISVRNPCENLVKGTQVLGSKLANFSHSKKNKTFDKQA